jgi:hypothetical protein
MCVLDNGWVVVRSTMDGWQLFAYLRFVPSGSVCFKTLCSEATLAEVSVDHWISLSSQLTGFEP